MLSAFTLSELSPGYYQRIPFMESQGSPPHLQKPNTRPEPNEFSPRSSTLFILSSFLHFFSSSLGLSDCLFPFLVHSDSQQIS
jgi:hypothetical protein